MRPEKLVFCFTLKIKIMGIIRQGVIGAFSGKVGNVVGASWKGIAYMRILPASVANPKTDLQLDQRMRFTVTLRFLQPLTQFLKTGFKNYAVKMSAFNNAMSYNLLNAIQGTYPNYTIDYPNALVTRGNLAPALNPAATSTVAGTVLFTWTDNSDEANASATDQSLLVVEDPEKNQAVYFNLLGTRADGTQSLTVPHSFSGDLVHCYMGFITVDGKLLSNSKYAGAVTVA
jgi:hypothetical protein